MAGDQGERVVMRRAVGLLLVVAVAVVGCRPTEPLVEEFMAAVVDGDRDRAWSLATGDATEPIREAGSGVGVALDRGHFDAAFGQVVHAHRHRVSGWDLINEDGTVVNVSVAVHEVGVAVRPTNWSVTVADGDGPPSELQVDGHAAVVEWRDRSHAGQWHANVYTFEGPKVFEVMLANGMTMTARAVRELEGQWRTCCVHFNAATGDVTVFRPGPHRPEGM